MNKELKNVVCSLVGDWHLAKCRLRRHAIRGGNLGGRDGQEVQVDILRLLVFGR